MFKIDFFSYLPTPCKLSNLGLCYGLALSYVLAYSLQAWETKKAIRIHPALNSIGAKIVVTSSMVAIILTSSICDDIVQSGDNVMKIMF